MEEKIPIIGNKGKYNRIKILLSTELNSFIEPMLSAHYVLLYIS
jgi:hypothetical protein